mgnify:CR=1 FL=1
MSSKNLQRVFVYNILPYIYLYKTKKIWEIGLHKLDTRSDNILTWKGKNYLGFALMKVRVELMEHNN